MIRLGPIWMTVGKQNFRKAEEILAEVWSNTAIDTHPVHAEFLENAEVDSAYPDENWVANHVRQSQYVLQVVRCNDIICCGDCRSNWTAVVHSRFLPAPYPCNRQVLVCARDRVKMNSKKTPS